MRKGHVPDSETTETVLRIQLTILEILLENVRNKMNVSFFTRFDMKSSSFQQQ
jgi:hypothetical protein